MGPDSGEGPLDGRTCGLAYVDIELFLLLSMSQDGPPLLSGTNRFLSLHDCLRELQTEMMLESTIILSMNQNPSHGTIVTFRDIRVVSNAQSRHLGNTIECRLENIQFFCRCR